MRITRIYIEKYKGLENFEVFFDHDISILVGENWSGKSRILEFISDVLVPIKNNKALLVKGNFEIEFSNGIILSKDNWNKNPEVIPRIIAYYSWDNKWLENLYDKYDQLLVSELVKNAKKKNKADEDEWTSIEPTKNTFFFRPYYLEVILIYLFMMREYNEGISELLFSMWIEEEFNLMFFFKKPSWGDKKKQYWWSKWKLIEIIQFIEHMSHEKTFENWEQECHLTLDWRIEAFLQFDWGKDFGILEAFDLLYINWLLENISFSFRKNWVIWNSTQLSEWERQNIIINGLKFYFWWTNTLMLLDEPDAYLHPKWQREYIPKLQETFLTDGTWWGTKLRWDDHKTWNDNIAQLILTTHSPLLIWGSEKVDVVGLSKWQITCATNPKKYKKSISDIDVYGNRADFIYKEVFGLESTRALEVEELVIKLHDSLWNQKWEIQDPEIKESRKQLSKYIWDDITDIDLSYLSSESLTKLLLQARSNEKNK